MLWSPQSVGVKPVTVIICNTFNFIAHYFLQNAEDAGLSNKLQAVTLTALSNEECRLYFGNQITDNMVCVDGNYNQGTCLVSVMFDVSRFYLGCGCLINSIPFII